MRWFLVLAVHLRTFAHQLTSRPPMNRVLWRSSSGQATTEYAMVLLAAALVGVLVIGWATAGGGAAAIGRLFDKAIDSAVDQL